MQYVYILKSAVSDKYYIRISNNCTKRLKDHNTGKVRSTKAYKPWRLALVQGYKTKTLAKKIELKLKKLKRKDYLKKIVSEKIIRLGP